MTQNIHSSSIVGENVKIGNNVTIGPFCVLEDNITIGNNVRLWNNVYVGHNTHLADDVEVHMNAVVGHIPQHTAYDGAPAPTYIGERTILREGVTVHKAWVKGDETRIGADCFLMVDSHVAHDCIVGNNVTMMNASILAGHSIVQDYALISGNAMLHQFCRIGYGAFLSGGASITNDVPPFCIAQGRSRVHSLNVVGLKRNPNITKEDRVEIKTLFKTLYRKGKTFSQALEIFDESTWGTHAQGFIDFVKESRGENGRGICAFGKVSR